MINVDLKSAVPIYLQIREEVRRLIAMGALRPGDRLPTVREIAELAHVNRNTAARAIGVLQREGLVQARVGKGTFIGDGAPPPEAKARDAVLDAILDRVVVEAHGLGLPLEELGWRLSRRIDFFLKSRVAANLGRAGEGR